jgi:multicomponent Na+:H+ antiporter subunit D
MTSVLPPLPVALPLLGAALLAALHRWLKRAVADSIAIAMTAVTFAVSAKLVAGTAHGTTVYWFGNWYPRGSMVLGIGFVVDPIGAGLACLAALLTLLALIFSWLPGCLSAHGL